MPGPQTPASAGPVLPPISNGPLVDGRGFLTVAGLNIFQQLWAGVFGSGGGIINRLADPGDVKAFAGALAPTGWLLCDGTAYSETAYPDLFVAIGTTWGTGGVGTFRVPDMRGRLALGADGTHALGTTGGAFDATLTQDNLPDVALPVTDPGHTHVVTDPGHAHTITDAGHVHAGGFNATATNTAGAAAGTGTVANTGNATTGITVDPATTGVTNQNATTGVTVKTGGIDAPVDVTPPYAAVNWLIKT